MTRRSSPTRLNPVHLEFAKSRLRDVLSRRVIATVRILEHEISDTGQEQLEPLILGMARKTLVRDGELNEIVRTNHPSWFHLPDAPAQKVEARLAILAPVHRELSQSNVGHRRGQCLELAIYRALGAGPDAHYLGRFPDFDPSNPKRTESLYRKEEPPSYIGDRKIPGGRPLDFLYAHPTAGFAGVEAKNVRRWLYPDGNDIKALLSKCVALDCVPVLVARRFPRATIEVLSTCGVLLHQTLNQLYCAADRELAARAMRQDLFGFDDIRVGDEPDARLSRFIGVTLPKVLPDARIRFDKFKDLLDRYSSGEIQYHEFAGRVQLRAAGNEEADWEDDSQDHADDNYY